MPIQLYVSDSVAQAIRLPEDRMVHDLQIELALALYNDGMLSFGKARELADLGKYEFGQLLGKRDIVRHYGTEELEDDIAYACGQ